MRIKSLLSIVLMVSLLSFALPVNAQASYSTYNGDSLYSNFYPIDTYGCSTYWYPGLLSNPSAWMSANSGGCAANGTIEVVSIKWKTTGPIWIDYIMVWGDSQSLYMLTFYAPGGNISANTSGFDRHSIGTLSVNSWVPSGDIFINKYALGYEGLSNPIPASIHQVEIHWRAVAPTAIPTNTPRPSSTAAPTTTGIPTIPPANTLPPLNTHIAPKLSPEATVDTCPSDDITTPCADPMYIFPTMAVPTLYLPSPTAIALLPTNTPAPMTFTPSPTHTTTLTPTPTGTIIEPTIGPPTEVLPTLNVTAWVDGLGSLSNAIPTLAPLMDISFGDGTSTPVGILQGAEQLGSGAGKALALAKALQLSDLNKFGGVITFGFLLFMFSVLVEVAVLVAPFILKVLTWIWKLIKLIPIIE